MTDMHREAVLLQQLNRLMDMWQKPARATRDTVHCAEMLEAVIDDWREAMSYRDEQPHQIEYQVWQDGMYQASSDDLADAKHYMAVYGQDGPVQLREVISYSRDITGDGQEKGE